MDKFDILLHAEETARAHCGTENTDNTVLKVDHAMVRVCNADILDTGDNLDHREEALLQLETDIEEAIMERTRTTVKPVNVECTVFSANDLIVSLDFGVQPEDDEDECG